MTLRIFNQNLLADSGVQWQSDAQLLSALLPSLMFLFLIAFLVVAFLIYMKRKRVSKLTPLQVKPAEEIPGIFTNF